MRRACCGPWHLASISHGMQDCGVQPPRRTCSLAMQLEGQEVRTLAPGGRITAPFSAASQMGRSQKTSSSRCFSPPLITYRRGRRTWGLLSKGLTNKSQPCTNQKSGPVEPPLAAMLLPGQRKSQGGVGRAAAQASHTLQALRPLCHAPQCRRVGSGSALPGRSMLPG